MKIRMTEQETRQIYKEMLDEKKTLRSKKIWLKKWLKECQDQLSAYKTACSRKPGDRWYLGQQINSLDIRQTEREIVIINEITATL